MTSLVTGGAGFIGSHVADEILKTGEMVVILDDLSGGFRDNIVGENVIFVEGSITDVNLVDTLFRKYEFDYVYHLAAYAAEGLSHFIKRFNYQNNLIGSVNLINAIVNFGVKAFVFTSSIAVYGKNQLPMHEELTPLPEDSYGIAKLAVEQELAVSKEMFNLPNIIFRPHNVYGERQNIGDKYRNVVGIYINQILQNKPMTIFGDGMQSRAFSYIGDEAPIIASSVHNYAAYNQIFNIGADTPYTVKELAIEVARSLDREPEICYLQERQEVKHAYASHDKVRRFFDMPEPASLQEGLARMANWVKLLGPRSSKKFENIEITKNLPPSWLDV